MTILSPSTLINGPGYVSSGQAAGAITPIQIQAVVSSLAGVFISSQTTAYTLQATDIGTAIEVNVTAPATAIVFVPTNASVAFDIGASFEIRQIGTGQVGVAAVTPATTTILSSTGTYVTWAQGSPIGLSKRGTDSWLLTGERANATDLVPIQANYIPGQDLSNGTNWGLGALTATTSDTLKETATTAVHDFANQSAYTRAAAIKSFQFFVDVTPTVTRYLEVAVYDSAFAAYARSWFDVIGMATSTVDGATWTAQASHVLPMGGNTVRCGLTFTTDASTTNFNLVVHLAIVNGTETYLGNTSNGMQFDNLWLYNVNAGAGGT